MIPGEREAVVRNRQLYGHACDGLTRMLDLLESLMEIRGLKTDLPRNTAALMLALCHKQLRLGRAVQVLAMHGFGTEAMILTRSMLECATHIIFLAKRNVRLVERRQGKFVRKALPAGTKLSAEFRASLFAAKCELSKIMIPIECAEARGLKRMVRKKDLTRLKRYMETAERHFGTEWMKRLRSQTYAGLPITHLIASMIPKARSGAIVLHYPDASRIAHGWDAENYFNFEALQDNKWEFSVPDRDEMAMGFAEHFLLLTCDVLNNRFQLGSDKVKAEHERIRTADRARHEGNQRRRRRR